MAWKGERLKSVAKERGMSLTRIADLLSVSRQAVNDWVKGQVPRGTHLIDLSGILDVNPSFFFTDDTFRNISVPLHRKRGVAKVTDAMRKQALNMVRQYEKFFKWSSDPGLVQILRLDHMTDQSAVVLSGKLRGLSGIEKDKPMDYQHTFSLLSSLKIVTIFRYFPEDVKGYAFYSKIHNHRVVFVNNLTNVLDLIFPLLHEAIHAITDGETIAHTEEIESFCDSVANYTQFPKEYVLSVHNTIKGRREATKINILKDYSSKNSHSMFGIIEALMNIYPNTQLNVGGANSNIKKRFPTIGDVLFKDKNPLSYIDKLRMLSPLFLEIVSKQIDKVSTRVAGEWLGLENIIDARQTVEALREISHDTGF